MYVCLIQHPGQEKKYMFDCTDVSRRITVGSEVVCETINGLTMGTVVSFPTKIEGLGAKEIVEQSGAYWPLKKVVRRFGEVDLLHEERLEIAKKYIIEHAENLPF
nr:hypothetical protein [Aneurinibacillus sp. XH2]